MTREKAINMVKKALEAERAAIEAEEAAERAHKKALRACRDAAGVTVPRFDRDNKLPGGARAIWCEAYEQFEAERKAAQP